MGVCHGHFYMGVCHGCLTWAFFFEIQLLKNLSLAFVMGVGHGVCHSCFMCFHLTIGS